MSAPQRETLRFFEQNRRNLDLELSKGGNTVRVFRTINKAGYAYFTIAFHEHGKRRRKCISDEAERTIVALALFIFSALGRRSPRRRPGQLLSARPR